MASLGDISLEGHSAHIHASPSSPYSRSNVSSRPASSPYRYDAARYRDDDALGTSLNSSTRSETEHEFARQVARFPETIRGSGSKKSDKVFHVKKIAVTKSQESLPGTWNAGSGGFPVNTGDDYYDDEGDYEYGQQDMANSHRGQDSQGDSDYDSPQRGMGRSLSPSFDAVDRTSASREAWADEGPSPQRHTSRDYEPIPVANRRGYPSNRQVVPPVVELGLEDPEVKDAVAAYRSYATSAHGARPSTTSSPHRVRPRTTAYPGRRGESPVSSPTLTAIGTSRAEQSYTSPAAQSPVGRQASQQRPATAHASAGRRSTASRDSVPSTGQRPVTAALQRRRAQESAGPSNGLAVTGARNFKSKSEYLSELKRLQARVRALESDQSAFFRSRVLEAEAHKLADIMGRLDSSRQTVINDLAQRVTKARTSVRRVEDVVREVGTGSGKALVDRLGRHVSTAEKAISSFRDYAQHHYDAMENEAEVLSSAVHTMEQRIELWESEAATKISPVKGRGAVTARQKARAAALRGGKKATVADARVKDLPAEVLAVDKLLAEEGGHTGGWDGEDHQTFVRLHQRFYAPGRADEFAARCLKEIPAIHTADVFAHLDWYGRYNKLIKLKKAAVSRWKAKHRAAGDVDIDLDDIVGEDGRSQSRAQLMAEKRQRAAEREAKAARIAEWKASKQRSAREAWQAKQDAAMKEEEKRERERLRRQETRERVAMFKQKKATEKRAEEAAKLAAQRAKRRPPSARELAERREQDAMVVAKRQAAQAVRRREREITERRLKRLAESVKPKVAADRSRLRQATVATVQHHEDEAETAPVRYGGGGRPAASRVAVPSWRKGL